MKQTLKFTSMALVSLLVITCIYSLIHQNSNVMDQPLFIWNDDLEGLPADGKPVMLQQTSNDTIYLGTIQAPGDYHIECIGNGEVKLMDENYKEIRATTIDSIGYYIIEDNI